MLFNIDQRSVNDSELTFKLLIESVPNAIVLADRKGKIVYVNNQAEKLFRYSKAELIGQSIETVIPVRFRGSHPGYREAFFDSPSVRAMGAGRELFALRKDGVEIPIEIGLNPIITGNDAYVLASIIDISQRKKAEQRFKLMVNSVPHAIVLVSKDGIITLVNDAAKTLFEYEEREMIGRELEMLIPERFWRKHPEFRNMFFLDPQTRAMGVGRELFAVKKDGSEIPVEIGLNPIETEEGSMVLASIIDITQRKIQEEVVKRQVKLEIKNKELEQLAYIASHDLQEPLRTVSNYVLAFEEDFQDMNEAGKKYLHSIKRATSRMSVLVRSLLEYARVGDGREFAPVDCKEIIEEIKTDLTGAIDRTGAVIHAGNLPTLRAYEVEMRQLFQNLISNAIKFHQKNTTPEIHISAKKIKDRWEFAVKDNGIGIDPSHFERIFQIFQRLHSVDKYEGNGIGLSNCKKIVELHGGDIWVESVLGEGATFYFTILV